MFGWNDAMWFAVFTGTALRSTAVLAAASLSVFLLRRHSAATRHLVWTAGLAGVVALPFLLVSLPALHVPTVASLLPGATGVIFRASAARSSDAGGVKSAVRPAAASSSVSGAWSPNWKIALMLLQSCCRHVLKRDCIVGVDRDDCVSMPVIGRV